MKKVMLAVVLSTLVGCASTGDLEGVQAQVDALKVSTTAAIDAAAVNAATMCTNHCDKELNGKLDSLFKKSMTK